MSKDANILLFSLIYKKKTRNLHKQVIELTLRLLRVEKKQLNKTKGTKGNNYGVLS